MITNLYLYEMWHMLRCDLGQAVYKNWQACAWCKYANHTIWTSKAVANRYWHRINTFYLCRLLYVLARVRFLGKMQIDSHPDSWILEEESSFKISKAFFGSFLQCICPSYCIISCSPILPKYFDKIDKLIILVLKDISY